MSENFKIIFVVSSCIMIIVGFSLFVFRLYYLKELNLAYSALDIREQCEKDLPRNKQCEIIAVKPE